MLAGAISSHPFAEIEDCCANQMAKIRKTNHLNHSQPIKIQIYYMFRTKTQPAVALWHRIPLAVIFSPKEMLCNIKT